MNFSITPTYYYIAKMNRSGGNQVLKAAGYEYNPQSPEEMAAMFNDYVETEGEVAKQALAAIHPDSFLFESMVQKSIPDTMSSNQTMLNCSGCTKGQMLSADAITVDPNKALSVKNYNTLIIAGASVVVLGLITLIVVKS
jgi:hypothetical protein